MSMNNLMDWLGFMGLCLLIIGVLTAKRILYRGSLTRRDRTQELTEMLKEIRDEIKDGNSEPSEPDRRDFVYLSDAQAVDRLVTLPPGTTVHLLCQGADGRFVRTVVIRKPAKRLRNSTSEDPKYRIFFTQDKWRTFQDVSVDDWYLHAFQVDPMALMGVAKGTSY